MTLQVEVVSPERILWSGEADMVIARTIGEGEIAFLTGHALFVGALDISRVVVRPPEGADEVIAVHGGFVEVSNDRVTILSDVAELKDQIDVPRARAALERAQEQLRTAGEDDKAEAEEAQRRAELRLAVAESRDGVAAH
jgi:F-type H+-transporting ATPase subunit epsilon